MDFRESYSSDREDNTERRATKHCSNSPFFISKYDTPKHHTKKQLSGDHEDVKKQQDLLCVKFIPSPPKRKWPVSYNNRNYIKSQLSEDIMEHLLEQKKEDNSRLKKIWKTKDEMFGNIPAAPPKAEPGVVGFIKNCYADSFKWDIIKSWTMFAFGVYISKEICSIDFSATPAPM